MKIQVISDLHLEFQDAPDIQNHGADVLILSGDICLAEHLYRNPLKTVDVHGNTVNLSEAIINKGDYYYSDARKYREFFKRVSGEFGRVMYVMGNHEHYSGRWDRTETVLKEELSLYPNIHLLEQNKVVIDDTVFLGASLWTDMNKSDPLTLMSIRDMMSDYRAITEHNENGAYHRLRPNITIKKHRETVEWLNIMLQEDKRKTVIVTHHAPSLQSVHPRYRNQTIMNGAFCSDLEYIMLDFDQIALWTHGHVHDPWDYVIGNTRVLCNPHGYPDEPRKWNPSLVVEI